VHKGFWWGNLREGAHFEEAGIDARTIVKWIFAKLDGARTTSILLRIRTGDGLL
jgi:hypothetical protein